MVIVVILNVFTLFPSNRNNNKNTEYFLFSFGRSFLWLNVDIFQIPYIQTIKTDINCILNINNMRYSKRDNLKKKINPFLTQFFLRSNVLHRK